MAAKSLPLAGDVRLDDIMTLEAFCERYPDLANPAKARWWIYNRQSNGLAESGASIKRAGRWYLVVPRVRDWLLHAEPAPHAGRATQVAKAPRPRPARAPGAAIAAQPARRRGRPRKDSLQTPAAP